MIDENDPVTEITYIADKIDYVRDTLVYGYGVEQEDGLPNYPPEMYREAAKRHAETP